MANIANNTALIRGENEQIEKAIQELENISYCGDAYFNKQSSNEYDVIFYSRWGEPLDKLIEISKKYSVEIDGYTREFGCGYYSQWEIVNGEKVKYNYGHLVSDIETCPNCGNEDISPNEIESSNTFISYVWRCDNCDEETFLEYDIQYIDGDPELKFVRQL